MQEAGVDEADIVKTDGKYLYSYVYQNTTSQSPAIFIADAQEMTLTATIEVDPAIDEFYLDGDRLVTVGYSADELPAPKQTVVEATDDSLVDRSAASGDAASWNGGSWDGGVEMTVYDISDPGRTAGGAHLPAGRQLRLLPPDGRDPLSRQPEICLRGPHR